MKSRLFLLTLLVALSLGQFARAADERVTATLISPSRIQFSVRTDGLTVSERQFAGQRYDEFALPGEGASNVSNAGLLPTITRFVAIPTGATLHAEATVASSHTLQTGRTPIPADSDPTFSQTASFIGMAADGAALVTVGKTSVMRGVNLAPVTICPVSLNQTAGSYSIADRIEVTLEIESGARSSNTPRSLTTGSDFDRLLEGVGVLNVRRDDPPQFAPIGRYLILVREECLPYAIPLLEWKRQAGYDLQVMSYTGEELAGDGVEFQIRDRIRDIYNQDLASGREPFDFIWIIGDREGNGGGNPWTFPAFVDLTTMAETPPHADWAYGLMDADEADFMMDVGVSRLPAGNVDRMELMVGRQLAYEKSPFMGDAGWFSSAGVFTERWGDEFTDDIYLNVRWSEQLLRQKGFGNISIAEDIAADEIDSILQHMLNEGRGVLIGRAQVDPWWHQIPALDDNRIFPYCINFSGHGEFTAYNLFGAGSGAHLKGPVVWTNGWGQPITKFSNAVWNALVSGVFAYDLPIGWARASAGLRLSQVVPNRRDEYRLYQTDLDVFGDPGLKPWIGTPRRVAIQHPPARIGMDLLGVRLTNPADATPIRKARVTLYQPGELPEPAGYADWTPNVMLCGTTDDSGKVRFVIPGSLQAGTLYITATGRDLLPTWDSVNVVAANTPVFMVDNIEIPNEGQLIAGTRVDLNLTIFNSGADAGNVSAQVTSNSRLVQIVAGQASFGNVARGRQAIADRPVTISISPGCPNGFQPPVTVVYTYDGGTVNGALALDVEAPELTTIPFADPFPLSEDVDISPVVRNVGRALTPQGNVSLISLDWQLQVRDSVATYPGIAAGGQTGANEGSFFRFRSRLGVIPGSSAKVGLIFRSNEGVIDTVELVIPLGTAAESTPDGPDAYGYICLDSRDTVGWDGPQFNRETDSTPLNPWDQACLFAGDSLPMATNDLGSSGLVNLPFPFRFYGSEYNQITVCSNGFIAVGDQRRQIDFQNSPLDIPAGGACGMIAPFWDHLTFVNSSHGGVYTYYDSTAGTYTVQWYHMRFPADDEQELLFETVLFDPRHARTTSGDSPIRFNYRQIHQNEGDVGRDIAFASVGISSPDGTTGLSINYDSSGTAATRLVQNRSSLLFVTAPRSGVPARLDVTVTDSSNGRPLEDVITSLVAYGSDPLQIIRTDADGLCRLTSLPPGDYQVVVQKSKYNRLSRRVNLFPDGSHSIHIALTHPEMRISRPLIDSLQPNFQMFTALGITNHGNGPLNWEDTVSVDSGAYVVQIGNYYSGVVAPGGSAIIPFYLSTFGIPEGIYIHTVNVRDPLAEIDTTFIWRIVVDRNTKAGEDIHRPVEWRLSDAFPNPFNSATRFELSVAKAGHVKLALYDGMGRFVASVWDGKMNVGVHPITLDAMGLPPGIYFARMDGEGYRATRKIVLMK